MLKADLGDFLYILIAIALMVAGGVEKYIKSKKQQQGSQPVPPPRRYEEIEEVDDDDEDEQPNHERTQPQNLEDMVRRMVQTAKRQEEAGEIMTYPVEAQSLETIPEEDSKPVYQAVTNNMFSRMEEEALYSIGPADEKEVAPAFSEDDFDLRKAVIASEILKRKY